MKKKEKNNKKLVLVSNNLYPTQINELAMCCFVIKKDRLDDLLSFVVNNGGRVVSAIQAHGVSRHQILNTLEGYKADWYFVFAMCQKEVSDVFMTAICREFEFHREGRGFCFVLDILGYMGAKGPFVE